MCASCLLIGSFVLASLGRPLANPDVVRLEPAPAATAQAPKVWVNTTSGVYHCPGSRYYGTTRAGQYMGEAEAKAAGYRPAYGKPCNPNLASAPAAAAAAPAPQAPRAAPAGQVWVNTSSGVYHCPGSRYYGTTRQGQYMTESAARAGGFRPAYGRACS